VRQPKFERLTQLDADYNWVVLWRSILSLSAFIVSKIDDLRIRTTKMDDLISQVCQNFLPGSHEDVS
jgi:hypothetical protein